MFSLGKKLATGLSLSVLLGVLSAPATAQSSMNMYCSFPDTAWCQAMANGFRKASGITVNVTQKATGELYAQIRAEKENPKGDIWWAGPGDAFVQAGQEGLLEEYRSPMLVELHDWASKLR
jgi:iron(III) transport system substrate-binding protein